MTALRFLKGRADCVGVLTLSAITWTLLVFFLMEKL